MQQVAVLKMVGVGFTYPATSRQVLKDVTVRCNLNSRVAVLGVRALPACCLPAACGAQTDAAATCSALSAAQATSLARLILLGHC